MFRSAVRLPVRAVLCAVLLLPILLAQGPVGAQTLAPLQPTAAEEPAPDTAGEQARALVDVLRDEAAREALIAELERLAAGEPGPAEAEAEAAIADEEPAALSLGRRAAAATQETAQTLAAVAARLWSELARAPQTFAALDVLAEDGVLLEVLEELALVIVATYAVYLALRLFARRLYRRMGAATERAGPARTVFIAIVSILIDAANVVVAWAAGYALMVAFFGEFGSIAIRQSLYLNAFLAVEMVRVAIRAVLSPSTGDLRFIGIPDRAASYLSIRLGMIAALVGYGELLLVPIVNQNVSWLAGRALSSFLGLIAILAAIVLVLRARRPVARWLLGNGGRKLHVRVLRMVARHWHWPILAYLVVLLVLVIARPGGLLIPILGASAQILIAIVAGMVVANALTRAISGGISLPERERTRLPLLERRLNTFIPWALIALRLVIILAVLAFALDVIGLADVGGWLETEVGLRMTAIAISVALVLLVAFLLWLALASWVDYRLNPEYGRAPTIREQTLLTLLRNAATIAILVITLMFVLSEMGLDIAPLLASAGVLGLAIGFGSQKMVQDIITGVFIQFENAINVGDVITAGGTTGVVERLTIRSVSLRDLEGTFHIIPFSSVDMVSNFNKGFAHAVVDIGIAYQEDVGEARSALEEAYERLRADPESMPNLIGDLEWFGLQAFGDSAVVLRVRIKTLSGSQWAIGRKYNECVKQVFDERGIEIPFPHRTIYWGEAKEGRTPPLRVAREGGAEPVDGGGPARPPEGAGV